MSIEIDELLERIRKNDTEAYEIFYKLFYPMTFRAAYTVTGDKDLALDPTSTVAAHTKVQKSP